jgi:GTP-binding protein
MNTLPQVAIVGRTNVGKSSLFNRLVGRRQAIVANESGTTRDNVTAQIKLADHHLRIVDTAGLKSPEDEFELSIQDQIHEAAQNSALILVVVEAATTVTEEDLRVMKTALKTGQPVALIVNKIDQAHELDTSHWQQTPLRTIFTISATHGQGMDALEEFIVQNTPKANANTDDDSIRVALIGRPNAGKSTLFNSIAQKQQAIVGDVAGTTRDINSIDIKYHGQTITFLDTAGVRKPGKVESGVEQFSVMRTLQAIDMADICLLVMDANELNVQSDKRLAGMITDSYKGLVMAVTKWDTIEKDEKTQDKTALRLANNFQHAWWAPLIFLSGETGNNVNNLFELITDIHKRRGQEMKTSELNRLLKTLVSQHPPSAHGVYPKLKYMTQTGTYPPTLAIHGRNLDGVHFSYRRFIDKALRDNWDLSGTPIKVEFKGDDSK